MVRETVEITGEVIQDEAAGVPVRYYHLERNKFDCVQSCQGDLIVICNALADYAGLLSEYLKEEGEHMNACGRIQYELHIRRCLKIEKLISEQIGYDREAAIEKCRKKNHSKEEDVGEDFPETNVRILCRESFPVPLPKCRIRKLPDSMASQRMMAPAMRFWDNPFGKKAPSTSRVRIRAVVLLVKIICFIFLILSIFVVRRNKKRGITAVSFLDCNPSFGRSTDA